MKTKNIFLSTVLLLAAATTTTAQPRLYDQTKTFYEDGYAYQSDKDESARVTLYNKENKYTYERLVFKDGSDANGAIFLQGMKPLEKDDWTRKACGDIADKFFSTAEKNRVKWKEYSLSMIIDSSTGKVTEVYFTFIYSSPFATVPVSTYRKIELELKEKIWFTPTADGRRMKFIKVNWRHKVTAFQPIPETL